MATYPTPPDEAERLNLLHALNILDTPSEEFFDRITRLVALILDVPIALVSLVDTDRQWFKSRIGIDANETPREVAFCAHAIAQTTPLIVTDTKQDSRFMSNALVTGNPNIRFYAGVPLRSIGGLSIGTLCAIDSKPRQLSPDEISILVDLAALVSKEMQMREAMLLSHARSEQAIQAMEDVEARFRTIFERAGIGIAMVAPDGGWLRVNDALCQIVGYSQDELLKLTFQDITHPDHLDTDLFLLQQLINNDIDHYQLEKRFITKSKSSVWIQLIVTKKLSKNGELEYFISIIKNVQEQKEAEASLAELYKELENRVETRTRDLQLANEMLSSSIAQQLQFEQELRRHEAELQMVLQNANDAYVCIDHHGMIRDWNQQAEHTFGWSREEAIGRPLDETIIPVSMREAHRTGLASYLTTGKHHVINQHIELTAVRRDGTALPVEVRIRPLFIDGKTIFSAFLHDISERKKAEAIARAKRTQTSLALLYIDLDGFKQINDAHGHDAGDTVLRVIGSRLKENIRQTDTAVRLGGDEFTIVLENINNGSPDANMMAQKILESIQQPIQVNSATAVISASIGIAIHHADDIINADQLISQADYAMYEAKNAGKARVCVHK
ncbi:PAS domain S-box protein [Aeromonas caviae]|uniref:PAS domain S-box protein n=1 Tax=Aeromonas caviae TaxID=648 RepID=UPI00191C9B10|nr:PAS domain S-box protein [Aeromonas caviae]MBL0559238.1 PAS domain S-box protein [Aeromonas caviae]